LELEVKAGVDHGNLAIQRIRRHTQLVRCCTFLFSSVAVVALFLALGHLLG
jgi:hypothetical protein